MKTYTLNDLKPGMRVVFVDDRLNAGYDSYVETRSESSAELLRGQLAMVIVVQDEIGKNVGVAFAKDIGGHTCDGRVKNGHGMWVLPENLYSPEGWEEHKVAAAEDVVAQKKIDDLLADFIEG